MRYTRPGLALLICGALVLMLGLAFAPAPTPAAAMGNAQAPQPSPRPTLEPTPDTLPDDGGDKPEVIRFGRVTGTVIDTRTGAPAANKRVLVGETPLITDASGNYDTWVAPGLYSVGLQLAVGEGQPAQGMRAVEVTPDGTTVMHLFFASHAPIVTDVAPKTDAPTAMPLPTPVAVPTAAAAPVAEGVAAPARLPETAMSGLRIPAPVLLVGALLLSLGALLQLRPGRRPAVRRGKRRAQPSAEETLAELLRREL